MMAICEVTIAGMFSFCSEYSLSVRIPSSNKLWRYLSCSKCFILKPTVFPGEIAKDTRGLFEVDVGKSVAWPFDTTLANATAAPSIALVQ